MAINLPTSEDPKAAVSWRGEVEGTPTSMLVANGKLFVVTEQGSLETTVCDSGKHTI